jgi:hypothetical protein
MARELRISRNTVAKYLAADIQTPDQMRQQPPAEPDADTYKSLNNNIDVLPWKSSSTNTEFPRP